jgi:hypothetical protein
VRVSTRAGFRCCCAFIAVLTLKPIAIASMQSPKPGQSYPTHFPYRFSNFVWWSDDELRALLKKRIPGLGDEITPAATSEARVREVLKTLLKDKGIVAEVQSEDPSAFSLTAERVTGAPLPSIVFSILSPEILVDKVIVSQAPDSLGGEALHTREGREYSAGQDWLVRSNAKEELESKGYLESDVDVAHDAPRIDGDHYVVNLLISVRPGPQYRISAITADGGPLLKGRDLSSYFAEKPGEIADAGPFGRLAGQLRAMYWQHGYADVEIVGPPVLDHELALVSYHLDVTPGPLYHLRSLTIHNLNPEQESKARELLGMKSGDVFDEMAINGLSNKLTSDPLMKQYGFTFGPTRDKSAAVVDLTLDFYKLSDKGGVTIK